MKASTLKDLQDIFQIAADLKTSYPGAEDGLNEIISIVKKVILAEETINNSKFNLYEYCSNYGKKEPDFMKITNGVHYENGFKVCTDRHILIVMKETYSPDFENKTIDKSGTILTDGNYPNWKSVIPESLEHIDPNYQEYKFDFAKLKEYEKQAKINTKLNLKNYIRVKGCTYLFDYFMKLARFAETYGIDTMYVHSKRTSFVLSENNKGLVMPIVTTDNRPVEEIESFNKVFELN